MLLTLLNNLVRFRIVMKLSLLCLFDQWYLVAFFMSFWQNRVISIHIVLRIQYLCGQETFTFLAQTFAQRHSTIEFWSRLSFACTNFQTNMLCFSFLPNKDLWLIMLVQKKNTITKQCVAKNHFFNWSNGYSISIFESKWFTFKFSDLKEDRRTKMSDSEEKNGILTQNDYGRNDICR